MLKLTKEELMDTLREILGEREDGKDIEIYEAISDLVKPVDGTDWKKMYEELDAAWRKRYRDRFFEEKEEREEIFEDKNDEEERKYTYAELFKEDK